MSARISISRIHFPVTTLGPGRRIGIWLQGCSIRCPGCISADTWAKGNVTTSVREILDAIAPWISETEGFTISGGEPFDQPEALAELLAGIRSISRADVLVFSGFTLELLVPHLCSMDGLIDALIADPFEQSEPQTLALRGSDNQRLVFLTELGKERFESYERSTRVSDRTVDVMFDANGDVWFAGIPGRDDFRKLQVLLRQFGARIAISQDRGISLGLGERQG